MVRISGGQFCGRKLQVPESGVRPTKELVRQALFSVLGETIEGKRVADLFAGSGVIGLEALSRGAAEAAWIENDDQVFGILKQNVSSIYGVKRTSACMRVDGLAWLKSELGPKEFDLIVGDPPYKPPGDQPWVEMLLESMTDSSRLKPEGLFVMEQRSKYPVIDNPRWTRLKDTKSGDTRLVYYRRIIP